MMKIGDVIEVRLMGRIKYAFKDSVLVEVLMADGFHATIEVPGDAVKEISRDTI